MGTDILNHLVNSFCVGDYQAIVDYLHTLPKLHNSDTDIDSIKSKDAFYVINDLCWLASDYSRIREFDTAFLLAYATYRCAKIYLDTDFTTRKDEMLYFAGRSSYYILDFHLEVGNIEEGLECYEILSKDYKNELQKPEFSAAKITAVQLYCNSHQFEKARVLFSEIDEASLEFGSQISYDSVKSTLSDSFVDVSMLKEESSQTKIDNRNREWESMKRANEKGLETERDKLDEKTIAEFEEKIKILQQIIDCDDEDERLALSERVTRIGSEELDSENNNVDSYSVKNKELSEVFKNLDSIRENPLADEQYLRQLMVELDTLLPFFENKYPVDENNILTFLAWCYEWLEDYETALELNEKLRIKFEQQRLKITDLKERGGIFNQYAKLFDKLIGNYYCLGDPKGVLRAMETSKGRALNDALMEKKKENIVSYDDFIPRLEGLLAKENVHYLSYYIYETSIIGVLLTASGKYYAKGTEFSPEVIDTWTQKRYQNPANWQNVSTGLFGRKSQVDISKELEEHLLVVDSAMKAGTVKEGDHIVYSQDGNMVLFPMHYAKFKGRYLIEYFSLSRINNAYQLITLMEEDSSEFNQAICFSVPAKQDMENPEKLKAFGEVENWLESHSNLATLSTDSDIENLSNSLRPNSIVHFATHGVFPDLSFSEAKKNNPYYNSGILLNSKGEAPALDLNFDYYAIDNLLSPSKLWQTPKLFNKSHISFQACVSGRSKEGVSKDPIGMVWASFYCGAESILSAAWDIDIFWVNKFFISFYDYWLNKKKTRAEAYTLTIRDLLKNRFPEDKPSPYFWGGMILSGNWKN